MPSSITTNMGLIVPTVGQEPGPDWATDLNANLGVLDQHNHSSGQGVPITPSGMNISSDLPFNGNNATTVKTINFQAQSASLSGIAPNLGCVYVAGKELYYNDVVGNVVQITSNGSVNAGAGSITGLPSGTASASFSGGAFIWQSATNTPANTDTGAVILRNNTASSKGLTLSPPSAMAADIAQTLPVIPGATSFMQMDTAGNMSASVAISGGIVASNIADNTITYPKLSSASFNSPALLASVGKSQAFTSSGTYAVPTGVTQIYVIGCGGGGGGGGGGRNSGTGDGVTGGTAGGGGGAGSTVWEGLVGVTAGDTLTVTIGGGGGGGTAGPSNGTGGTGSTGTATTIVNGSSVTILSCPGGVGGTGGVGTTTNGTGGTGGSNAVRAGGTGTAGTTGASAAAGTGYLVNVGFGAGGVGGSVGSSSHGFGGAGGGGMGTGGIGGAGVAAANTGAGGGGGNGGTANNASSAGGAGGSGKLTIYVV